MLKQLINHVVFVVDRSGSMQPLSAEVVKVFDAQVAYLARRSKELGQETRVSVYLFNADTECLCYDLDCLRLPSLKNHYRATGNTALIRATLKAFDDLAETPQRYGDHAFLVYTLTDGQENASYITPQTLANRIAALPDNWTVSCLVPDAQGVHEAKQFGYHKDNISVWTTSAAGLEDVGNTMREATDSFMQARATGVRSTKTLFKLGVKATATEIKRNLKALQPSDYTILNVRKDVPIKEFIESWRLTFKVGANYYELMKPEVVQAYKQVLVQEKMTGTIYGGVEGRRLLGLPDHELKVCPGDYGDYRIFIQSTSSNRKLIAGTQLVVLR